MGFLPWHLAAAYILDLLAGDPEWFPHPIRWIGKAIFRLENLLYDAKATPLLQRLSGMFLWLIVVAAVICSSILLILIARSLGWIFADLVMIWLGYTTLATRSLHREASNTALALRQGDIDLARQRLSRIVSRDTSHLDEAGILRALIETVSENISDGIVAPLFYLALSGPIGAMAYKAINTMDSMLGYLNDRYRYFGWFPARADDVANFVPARLSGWLMVGASACMGMDWRKARQVMLRDAGKMKSPNAGYPESAAAGALGIELGGVNIYFGEAVEKPRLGEPLHAITLETYGKMIRLMYITSGLALFMALCILMSSLALNSLF